MANPSYVSLFSLRFTAAILSLLLLVGAFFWQISRITPSDYSEYQQLIAASDSTDSSMAKTPYTATQERLNVQKDLFFSKQNERLQIRLKAKQAQLKLDRQDFHTRFIEHMQTVKCTMQEELYYVLADGREAIKQANGQLLIRSADEKEASSWVTTETPGIKPMQIVRYIEADVAEYHYKGDRFVADQVKISRYTLSGHHIEEIGPNAKLLMKGTADKVEFALNEDGKDFNFKATGLKASFFDLTSSRLSL